MMAGCAHKARLGFFMLVGISLIAASAAHAQAGAVKRPISGSNLRFQIGGELQIPIQERTKWTPMGAPVVNPCVKPDGRVPTMTMSPLGGVKGVNPKPGAVATSFATGRVRIPTSAFTLRAGAGKAYATQVIGVKAQNPVAFQVATNFQIRVPFPSMTMTPTRGVYPHLTGAPPAKARRYGGMSGRTGPDLLSWCPGSTAEVISGINPGCAKTQGNQVRLHSCYTSPNPCPGTGYMTRPVNGFARYTRTGKMLGGPANGRLNGKANAVIGASPAGAFIVPLDINVDPAFGGSFGQIFQQNPGKGPGFAFVSANACGLINKVSGPLGLKVASNRSSGSFGIPGTQGMLTVKVATGKGDNETYIVTGYDKRGVTPLGRKGAGKVQFVTGSISIRSLTGTNANHGVLNFNVPEPTAVAGAAVALLVLVACHRGMNRRR